MGCEEFQKGGNRLNNNNRTSAIVLFIFDIPNLSAEGTKYYTMKPTRKEIPEYGPSFH